MELFNTPINSGVLIALTIVYAVAASITTFDARTIQYKKAGYLPPDHPTLSNWWTTFGWLLWVAWLVIFLLNWKYALVLFVIKFVLKVVPVLETVGSMLVAPFVDKKISDSLRYVGAQKRHAMKALKAVSKSKSPEETKEVLRKFRD